jgi:hypothetical protein
MPSRVLDLFFLSTLGQGAIRKWVAPDLSLQIQLFRDMLPLLALIIYYLQAGNRRKLGRFTGLATMLFWGYASVAALETLNVSLPLFVVLVGIRTHFAFLPLAILMPAYLKSWPHGLRKLRQLLILALPIFLLGVFQSTQPVESDWNRYADPEMAVATFSAVADVRASGTFAYITEFADFAGICAVIAVFLMLTTDSKIIGRLWNTGLLIMALGAIMASGSRAPAAIFGVQLLGLAALGYGVRAIPMRRLFPIVALTVVAVVASVTVLDRQATAFLLRTQAAADDVGWRTEAAFFEWLDVMIQYPLGVGLGAGHQAFYAQIPANIWEVELSRLAFELGLGVLLYIAFKVALIGQIVARLKAMRTSVGRVTLAICIVTLIPLLIGSVYVPLPNAAFWAFVGIGFWVVKLEAATLPALRRAAPKFDGTDRAARPGSLVGEGAR